MNQIYTYKAQIREINNPHANFLSNKSLSKTIKSVQILPLQWMPLTNNFICLCNSIFSLAEAKQCGGQTSIPYPCHFEACQSCTFNHINNNHTYIQEYIIYG